MNTNKLSKADQVIATMEANGRILATVCKSNFNSVQEVAKMLIALGGKFFGLAKLTIRNKTQGWTMTMALASQRRPTLGTSPSSQYSAAPHRGFQYSLW